MLYIRHCIFRLLRTWLKAFYTTWLKAFYTTWLKALPLIFFFALSGCSQEDRTSSVLASTPSQSLPPGSGSFSPSHNSPNSNFAPPQHDSHSNTNSSKYPSSSTRKSTTPVDGMHYGNTPSGFAAFTQFSSSACSNATSPNGKIRLNRDNSTEFLFLLPKQGYNKNHEPEKRLYAFLNGGDVGVRAAGYFHLNINGKRYLPESFSYHVISSIDPLLNAAEFEENTHYFVAVAHMRPKKSYQSISLKHPFALVKVSDKKKGELFRHHFHDQQDGLKKSFPYEIIYDLSVFGGCFAFRNNFYLPNLPHVFDIDSYHQNKSMGALRPVGFFKFPWKNLK